MKDLEYLNLLKKVEKEAINRKTWNLLSQLTPEINLLNWLLSNQKTEKIIKGK